MITLTTPKFVYRMRLWQPMHWVTANSNQVMTSSYRLDTLLRHNWPNGPRPKVHRIDRCVVQLRGPSSNPRVTHVVATREGLYLVQATSLVPLLNFIQLVSMQDVHQVPAFLPGPFRGKAQHILFRISEGPNRSRSVHCMVLSSTSSFPAVVRSLWITALINEMVRRNCPGPISPWEAFRRRLGDCSQTDHAMALCRFLVRTVDRGDSSKTVELLCDMSLLAERGVIAGVPNTIPLPEPYAHQDDLASVLVAGCVRIASQARIDCVQLFRHLYVLRTLSARYPGVEQSFQEEFRYLLRPDSIGCRIAAASLLKSHILRMLS